MFSFWKLLALTRETGECQKNFMNSLKCFQCTATLKTLDFQSTSEQRIFFADLHSILDLVLVDLMCKLKNMKTAGNHQA